MPIFAWNMPHFSNTISFQSPGKIYFASDFHLGAPNKQDSLIREKKVVNWLSTIREDASHIFLLGDLFDMWFEYTYTIPKGYTRLLGKMMEIRDAGIPITIFSGNHDMWMFEYFQDDFDIPVYKSPQRIEINDKVFLIGHGDGLGPADTKYKLLKKIFQNKISQFLFHWLHPDIGFWLAINSSERSRKKNLEKDQIFHGEDEWLFKYCLRKESESHHDYYIFGHRHLPLDMKINDDSRYINIGDWIKSFTYGVFDGKEFKLEKFGN